MWEIYSKTSTIQPDRINHWRRWLVILLTAIILFSIYYILLLSPLFRIKQIIIDGQPSTEITVKLIGELKGKNIFLLTDKKIKELQEKEPAIARIEFIRGLPDTLKVRLVERKAVLSWQNNSDFYLVAEDGVVFKKINQPSSGMALVKDNSGLPIDLGRRIISSDFINFIKIMQLDFSKATNLEIERFEVEETTFSPIIILKLGWKVYTAIDRQPDKQIADFQNIFTTQRDQISEYIDVRTPGRVYYK